MKKLKFIFLALILSLLFLSQGFAQTYLFQNNLKLVAQGSVTAANTQLSLVDPAFAYFSGVDLSAYQTGKHLLSVYNSSTGLLIAQGYCSLTPPAGETLDVDIFSAFNFTSGWSTATATITDANTFAVTGAYGAIFKAVLTSGALYKGSFAATSSAGAANAVVDSDWTASILGTDKYKTANTATFRIYNNLIAASVDVTTLSLCKGLDPASTGVRIEATPGGAQNWTTKGTGAVNAAITYKIFKVKN